MSGASPKRRESYVPAGGKAASLGANYQLAVLMYTFLRGLKMKVEFSLGAEVKEAGKFDDVVYRYRKDGKRINRLAQLKNKSDPKKSRITLTSLLSKNSNADMSLVMYLDSFRDIKGNFISENEEIRDLILYSNGWIKSDDKAVVNKGSDDEVTFIMKDTFKERTDDKGVKVMDDLWQTQLYCFRKDSKERDKWVKYLMVHSNSTSKDSEERVKLAEYLKENSSRINRKKVEKYFKEKSSRMDREEREKFEKCLTEKSSDKDREELGKYLMEKPLGKDFELEDDVDLFLDKLSIAFNQPEVNKLISMVREELKEYLNIDVDAAYPHFLKYMYEWLTGKECSYLYQEDGLKLIEDLVGKYGEFKFRVDRPVTNFFGREKELDDLTKAFFDEEKEMDDLKETLDKGKKKVVIFGLGGVGKTQLAKKFAERHSESYSCVIWIKSDSYEDLRNSFKLLAFDRLGIKAEREDGEAKNIESILEEVRQALQNRSSIFIFDNVHYMIDGTTGSSGLNLFLKKLPDNAALLMTSRCRNWDDFIIYPLKPLSKEDAILLIGKSLNGHITFEDEQVVALAAEMQNHPLAIQQVIAFIKRKTKNSKQPNNTFGIDSYLELFQANLRTLLEHQVQKYNEDDYFNTSMTTWDITMEDIRKEDYGTLSEKIFHTISYFIDDEIPVSDIIQCFSGEIYEHIIKSLQLLDVYSMVNLVNDHCAVHRIVQMVTRMKLKEKNKEEALLDSLLSSCEKLEVQNVVRVWEHSADHKHLIRKHAQMPKDVIENLIEKVRYADGYLYGKRLVKVMETILDPMDESMIEVNFSLAAVTRLHGLYDESYDVFKKVWECCLGALGEDHPTTLKVRNRMALVLNDLGRYCESHDISKEASENFEKILDPEDRDLMMARRIYAVTLRKMGEHVESYKILKELCDISERLFHPQHPEFITVRHELALVLLGLGRYKDSFDILRSVWEWKRKNKGEEHPQTLGIRNNMGVLLCYLGKYEESLEILLEVSECRSRILGEGHPNTLSTRESIELVIQKSEHYY